MVCRWEDIDVKNRTWRKYNSKAAQVQIVPLPIGLVTRINSLERCCDYVFHGGKCGTHMSITNIEKQWRRIRAKVGLDDVRIHDLRRTCASIMACNGENLAVIAQVLGHSGLAHVGTYARLNNHALREALDRHSKKLMEVGV